MVLSRRFEYEKEPILVLDEAQLEVRDRIISRLRDGTYQEREVPCFCGEEQPFVIAERDRYGIPVRTVMCPACGLLRTSPRMTQETTSQFYENDYRTLYTDWGEVETLWSREKESGQRLHDLLAREGLLEGVETVYEIGCGAGGSLDIFHENGFCAAGCDLGSEYMEYGRERGISLLQGEIADLVAHTGKTADLLFLCHVLEHFSDLRDGLRSIWEAISPGGLLVLEVPGLGKIEEHYRGDLLAYLQNAHNHHFCSETMRYVLEATGFEIVYLDQQVTAVARRVDRPVRYRPDRDTAREVMRFLADLERRYILSVQATQATC